MTRSEILRSATVFRNVQPLSRCAALRRLRCRAMQLADGRYQLANTSKVTRAKFAGGPLMHAELLVSQDWRPAASIFGYASLQKRRLHLRKRSLVMESRQTNLL